MLFVNSVTKTIIQSVLLFVAIVGAYSFYQQWNVYQSQQEAASTAYRDSFVGTHIMGNGDIMKPDGTILSEATITADGMILLPDGLLIKPAFDMRPKKDDIHSSDETMTMEEMAEMMKMETEETVPQVQPNTAGIHIMPNGDVMRGDGKVLSDATILADGNIQLSDGTIIAPAFDLRKSE